MGLGGAPCTYCGCVAETMLHVMRDCPMVMPIWLKVVHISVRSVFFSSTAEQWIKFNLGNDVGWRFRGSDGEWLGRFTKHIGYGTTYVAELWGVLEGLRQARRLNFNKVELCVDSMVVVKHITSKEKSSLAGRSHVEHIRRLMNLEWEVVVHHSY
ncbi:putative non-LTR retroelement reverse transcriptase [Trifolium medium]|uniref:Putative non-LTR retroelement reverse transcriptase n=1 Tax=Trifolium medium TaxID=97028 RepID=A0A392MSL2_9FABA|nr:putative non-LTR retroelement reverse transcriptase [Trifolium medium]